MLNLAMYCRAPSITGLANSISHLCTRLKLGTGTEVWKHKMSQVQAVLGTNFIYVTESSALYRHDDVPLSTLSRLCPTWILVLLAMTP
jgi:hypothetical protein